MSISRNELDNLMINRAKLYHLFARFFSSEVDEAFLMELKNASFPNEVNENSLTEFHEAIIRLNDYFEYDAGESIEDLAVDYAKTFLGAGKAEADSAFPYESVYQSPRHIMMQEAWSDVCDIYASKGIEKASKEGGLLEDHIAMELEFMALLCEETLNQTEALIGLSEQKEFLNNHLLNWVPAFCIDIKTKADTEFYRMIGQLTSSFLQLDSFILEKTINEKKNKSGCNLSYSIEKADMQKIIDELKDRYHVFAPKNMPNLGDWDKDGIVRHVEIDKLEEIVLDKQGDFSFKEVIYPVTQTIFTFDENSVKETVNEDPKGIIIFMRPCDINGLKRLDNMFLSNGGTSDVYYKRMRDKVRIFMTECAESFDNCFCVSMGTNTTDNYSVALRLHEDKVSVKIKDSEFAEYFNGLSECAYEPAFITENKLKVNVPNIDGPKTANAVHEFEMWKAYTDEQSKCIGCGGCNTVCPTCSCFDTLDYMNQENSRKGKRQRVWASCMLQDYSKTAGGAIARKTSDQMMRFKAMHKVYDYKLRFGGSENMCVGCGRCIIRCPQNISFAETINKLNDAVNSYYEEQKNN